MDNEEVETYFQLPDLDRFAQHMRAEPVPGDIDDTVSIPQSARAD